MNKLLNLFIIICYFLYFLYLLLFIIKQKLKASSTYTSETHKELVSNEITDPGYTKDSIDIWIKYIE